MSPSHQTRQTDPKSSNDTSLPMMRLVTPMVAAIAVLMMPARTTSASTSLSRSSDGLKSATQLKR